MKKIIFILLSVVSINAYASVYTDYKCERLDNTNTIYLGGTQRCENKEVVCYEKQYSIWCYRK